MERREKKQQMNSRHEWHVSFTRPFSCPSCVRFFRGLGLKDRVRGGADKSKLSPSVNHFFFSFETKGIQRNEIGWERGYGHV